MCGWYPIMVRHDQRELPSRKLAGYMQQTGDHPQSREVLLHSRRGQVCRLRNHQWHRTTMHNILVWLGQRCYPSGNYSSPANHSTGTKFSSKHSDSWKSPSMKSTTESKSLTKRSPYAWFQKHYSCPSCDLFCCKQGWKITLVGSTFHMLVNPDTP